jgi:thiamine pyrophosphokinase
VRVLIFLSGSICDDRPILALARSADCLICADGGVRHARRLGLRPDLVVGDMDSATDDDRAFIDTNQIPLSLHPRDKDETDAELAVQAALRQLDPEGKQTIMLAGAFGSRPDHVLATQLLAAAQASPLRHFQLTDGRSSFYTLAGPDTLILDLPPDELDNLVISAIPVSPRVEGLTYEGLLFPLADVSLEQGSSRGVSNKAIRSPIWISLSAGRLLVAVTPEE